MRGQLSLRAFVACYWLNALLRPLRWLGLSPGVIETVRRLITADIAAQTQVQVDVVLPLPPGFELRDPDRHRARARERRQRLAVLGVRLGCIGYLLPGRRGDSDDLLMHIAKAVETEDRAQLEAVTSAITNALTGFIHTVFDLSPNPVLPVTKGYARDEPALAHNTTPSEALLYDTSSVTMPSARTTSTLSDLSALLVDRLLAHEDVDWTHVLRFIEALTLVSSRPATERKQLLAAIPHSDWAGTLDDLYLRIRLLLQERAPQRVTHVAESVVRNMTPKHAEAPETYPEPVDHGSMPPTQRSAVTNPLMAHSKMLSAMRLPADERWHLELIAFLCGARAALRADLALLLAAEAASVLQRHGVLTWSDGLRLANRFTHRHHYLDAAALGAVTVRAEVHATGAALGLRVSTFEQPLSKEFRQFFESRTISGRLEVVLEMIECAEETHVHVLTISTERLGEYFLVQENEIRARATRATVSEDHNAYEHVS